MIGTHRPILQRAGDGERRVEPRWEHVHRAQGGVSTPVAERPSPGGSVVVELGMHSRESLQGSGDLAIVRPLAAAKEADEMKDLRLGDSLGVGIGVALGLRHLLDSLSRSSTLNGMTEVYSKMPPVDQGKILLAEKKTGSRGGRGNGSCPGGARR